MALPDERLEVAAELHAVRRVDVDHLHLAAESLVLQQRVHHDKRVAEHHAVLPLVLVLVRLQHLVGDRVLRVAVQVEQPPLRTIAPVTAQRLEHGLRAEPLVHEQRQRRHLERQPLCLPCPVEERPRQPLQLSDRVGERSHRRDHPTAPVAELLRLLELRPGQPARFVDLRQQPLPQAARAVLRVPVKGRAQRAVVAVRRGRLLLLELRLRADVGSQQHLRVRMPVCIRRPATRRHRLLRSCQGFPAVGIARQHAERGGL